MVRGEKSIQLMSLLLVCFLLAGCGATTTAVQKPLLVQTQTVQDGNHSQLERYSGEVKGRYESNLAFQVNGKIINRNVQLGTQVNAGDVLMQIDARDVQQTVNSAAAQVAAAESKQGLAASNLDRYRQLYDEGAVSQMTYDQYVNEYNTAFAAAQQAAAQYSQGTNQMGYTSLVADHSGVVSALSAEVGQVVSAGQTVLTVVQDGEREVEISVPENRVMALRNAGQVAVTFWALPDVTVNGAVREIAAMADPTTRTYKVRIRLIDPPPTIQLGMTASVAVAQPGAGQAIYIPLAALYQTTDTTGVWVVVNGAVTLRQVQVGKFGDNQVQILSGLQPGDVVVTAGVHKLLEGQQVRLSGEES